MYNFMYMLKYDGWLCMYKLLKYVYMSCINVCKMSIDLEHCPVFVRRPGHSYTSLFYFLLYGIIDMFNL